MHISQLLSVMHAGEWLGDRRLGGGYVLRDAIDAVHSEDLGGDAHEFREPTVVVVADRLQVLADGLEPATALEALAVGNGGNDLNSITHAPGVDPRSDLDDLPGDLMAHDSRERDVGMAVVKDLDVGPTGSAGKDPDDQVARAGLRLGKRLEPEVTRRVQACCLDGSSPWVLGVHR